VAAIDVAAYLKKGGKMSNLTSNYEISIWEDILENGEFRE
jgi:hypothetical protein